MKENFPIKVKKKSGKKINTAIGIVINEDDPKEGNIDKTVEL